MRIYEGIAEKSQKRDNLKGRDDNERVRNGSPSTQPRPVYSKQYSYASHLKN